MAYKHLVRRALFSLGGGDPEIAHERTMAALTRLGQVRPAVAGLRALFGSTQERTVFGVRFPGVVGLAAGMDKDGRALRAWPALGFGHVEVGTVTRHAQPGNPQPRLFRLRESEAIINRMGFNNAGADALAARLAALGPVGVPLGISIGKSKITPVEEAVEDYRHSLRALYPYGDYFAVNVSSPNTPGLRGLQDRAALDALVGELRREADELAAGGQAKPLLVKIAPDLTDAAISEVLQVCADHRVSGVIATNTTLGRDGLTAAEAPTGAEAGGLSGRPLAHRSREVVAFVARETGGALPIIGVGGVFDVDAATRMLDAGASLMQLYTGFVFEGPSLVRRINRAVASR
ncbi:quinone-dependent dihydroorotate dehydrogenase [Actinokineospora globicatena]|uniref:quinone-dependent dihydroorotate dehydrogenase n=1 Tax=Actinokineospora globicatena TaxID=103729 RepID=UPI0020A2F464|nr:quinone-dependent dihydroorotate dehydrogenase [Actinokineospora globicatena]MCP2304299.1 dihydroorotate oxidase A [Actinokineospora globicatena]GLW78339.1 dihydroorotate dehydrogenase (quinone) [Actinokineospora globicatena]GLW84997.1 dihydroorotate dehydrogenase (quinone) [Actinokineospora globicatena]